MRPYVLVVAQGLVVKRGKKIRILLFKQRFKQIFLVFEMPVKRAACYACIAGDGLERGFRHAMEEKGVEGGLQQLLAGFLGFGLGFSHGL